AGRTPTALGGGPAGSVPAIRPAAANRIPSAPRAWSARARAARPAVVRAGRESAGRAAATTTIAPWGRSAWNPSDRRPVGPAALPIGTAAPKSDAWSRWGSAGRRYSPASSPSPVRPATCAAMAPARPGAGPVRPIARGAGPIPTAARVGDAGRGTAPSRVVRRVVRTDSDAPGGREPTV